MKRIILVLMLISFLLGACDLTKATPTADAPTPEPTATLPSPVVSRDDLPDAEEAAVAYFNLWSQEDYPAMYDRLSTATKSSLSLEDFTAKHKKTAVDITLKTATFEPLSNLLSTNHAQVSYRIHYDTNLIGKLERDTLMNLTMEDGKWLVNWEPNMMLPELTEGNYLELVLTIPTRGNIYSSDASNNYPLVAHSDAVSLTIVPGQINKDQEDNLVAFLGELTNQSQEAVKAKYAYANADWSVTIGDISSETATANSNKIDSFDGLYLKPFKSRFYYDNGIAPHVTGYMLGISAEDQERYQRLGYKIDETVGASGLEKWGEKYLAGQRGADLYVKNAEGHIVTKIAATEAKPAQSITTTINSRLQYWLQKSMGDKIGAVVVLERDTAKVLSMVSSPGFDPNIFNPLIHTHYEVSDLIQNARQPLYNRASQGVYPPGSIFKVISMIAALQTGVFTPDRIYRCDSQWTEYDGWVGDNWTYKRGFASDGDLTLVQGLMRSCNPWFWHIGLTLWNDGYTTSIPDEAHTYGMGAKTGIEIEEFEGAVNYPENAFDYFQMAIGQSTLQVSALQAANLAATIGNGGNLNRPSLIERIGFMGEEPTYVFEPQLIRKVDTLPENLDAVKEGMRQVVRNPSGTAEFQFTRFSGNIMGKTGTAETALGIPHAWFIGFTDNQDPDKPDIAVAVVLEYAGEGSEMAAPLFRRAVSLYYSDAEEPGGTLPWEERPYILKEEEE